MITTISRFKTRLWATESPTQRVPGHFCWTPTNLCRVYLWFFKASSRKRSRRINTSTFSRGYRIIAITRAIRTAVAAFRWRKEGPYCRKIESRRTCRFFDSKRDMRFRGKNQWCISTGTPKAYLENMRKDLTERPAFRSLCWDLILLVGLTRFRFGNGRFHERGFFAIYVCEIWRRYGTRLFWYIGN